jgi:hypothetical protein
MLAPKKNFYAWLKFESSLTLTFKFIMDIWCDKLLLVLFMEQVANSSFQLGRLISGLFLQVNAFSIP